MKKLNRNTLRISITMLFISILIVTVYYYVRTGGGFDVINSDPKATQTELLIEKDIKNNYPATPKEVIQLYINISKLFYDRSTTEDELNKLSSQIRLLFDEELLEQNPSEDYLLKLKNEVEQFKEDDLYLMHYLTSDKNQVDFWTYEDKEYASRMVSYTVKKESNYTKIMNKFLLRKDNNGQWKILGWTKEDISVQDK